jgi:hypothetical protein
MKRRAGMTLLLGLGAGIALACGSGGGGSSGAEPEDGGTSDDRGPVSEAGADVATGDAGREAEASTPVTDTSSANRDRLLATYLAYLKAHPGAQTNGLDGASLGTVCDLWSALPSSAKDTFLTLTARLQGSKLGADGSSMLAHVVTLYRAVGGNDTSEPGNCGGGENNRLIVSMDATLHAAQQAASKNSGAIQSNGKPDIADVLPGTAWHDSQDLGGSHAPFDLSDESVEGGPRGQTQFFADPTSAKAKSPLARADLTTLVDPYALEIDQDYDCPHNSNPDCDYVLYGPACIPMTSKKGTDIYTAKYGSYDPAYKPSGCN